MNSIFSCNSLLTRSRATCCYGCIFNAGLGGYRRQRRTELGAEVTTLVQSETKCGTSGETALACAWNCTPTPPPSLLYPDLHNSRILFGCGYRSTFSYRCAFLHGSDADVRILLLLLLLLRPLLLLLRPLLLRRRNLPRRVGWNLEGTASLSRMPPNSG